MNIEGLESTLRHPPPRIHDGRSPEEGAIGLYGSFVWGLVGCMKSTRDFKSKST